MTFLFSILPALLMWEYASLKVDFRLSRKLRRKLYRVGFLVAIGAGIAEEVVKFAMLHAALGPLGHAAAEAGTAGIVEEALDLLGLLLLVDRSQVDEIGPAVAIPLGAGVALGFAIFENILYLIGAAHQHASLALGVVRAFTAIPIHGIQGMIMGAFVCIAWRSHRGVDRRALAAAALVPMALHAAYDFTVMAHALPGHPAWARVLLPAIVFAEGLFAAAMINIATNLRTAIYGRIDRADTTGVRTALMAICLILLGLALLGLAIGLHHPAEIGLLGAMPMILGADLAVTGLVRHRPAY